MTCQSQQCHHRGCHVFRRPICHPSAMRPLILRRWPQQTRTSIGRSQRLRPRLRPGPSPIRLRPMRILPPGCPRRMPPSRRRSPPRHPLSPSTRHAVIPSHSSPRSQSPSRFRLLPQPAPIRSLPGRVRRASPSRRCRILRPFPKPSRALRCLRSTRSACPPLRRCPRQYRLSLTRPATSSSLPLLPRSRQRRPWRPLQRPHQQRCPLRQPRRLDPLDPLVSAGRLPVPRMTTTSWPRAQE